MQRHPLMDQLTLRETDVLIPEITPLYIGQKKAFRQRRREPCCEPDRAPLQCMPKLRTSVTAGLNEGGGAGQRRPPLSPLANNSNVLPAQNVNGGGISERLAE
jgi:hypothetical protein